KIYYFAPGRIEFAKGDFAVVETVRGTEIGEVMLSNRNIPEENIVSPLKPVLRKATNEDIEKVGKIKEKEKKAFDICLEKIHQHNLDMHLVDVEYTFDENKILFYFTAEGRVDFRELVKSLASVFKTRIELRQIGVRDEAKMLGGIGVCGRPICCNSFLGDFQPVSIKMAKEQNLSLNPTKISGTCGRLMCCLKYEQSTYEEMLKFVPRVDAIVETPDGKGTVIDNNVLAGLVKVKIDRGEDSIINVYDAKNVVTIKAAAVKLTAEEIKELKKLEE
ncbi:MAG: stage 0 sporulation family protein, partial [Clostridia bacterium]|nr:stage 0 sporulation family protein [Clostridia bacterium]